MVSARANATAAVAPRAIVNDIVRDPALLLWALYILLVPMYVFKNGLPQPGDMLVLLLAPIVFSRWDGRLPVHMRKVLLSLLLFTGYAIVVNLFWSVAEMTFTLDLKTGFALSPIFYIYNVIVFLVALVMYQRYGERFIQHTVVLTIVTLVMQVVISFVHPGGAGRGKVFFNNPNQLGYFAVVCALIILLGQKRARVSSAMVTVGLLSASYLTLFSASKAGIAAMGLIMTFGLFDRLRTILLTGAVALVLLLTADPLMGLVHKANTRNDKQDDLSFAEERGYDRIGQHPEDWLFGAGEGYYRRYFTGPRQGAHELHSSVGTIFFCYGVVGSSLFLLFMFRVFKGAPFKRMLLLLPAIVYGLSHQGLRATLVWVLFAIYIVLKEPVPIPRRAGV
jgi:hypothetical protein